MRLPGFLAAIALLLISFSSSASPYYWVGGSGNWSDLNHWASTSGGGVHYLQVPTPTDDVFFDSKSFTAADQVVMVNVGNAVCAPMSWTGYQIILRLRQ